MKKNIKTTLITLHFIVFAFYMHAQKADIILFNGKILT